MKLIRRADGRRRIWFICYSQPDVGAKNPGTRRTFLEVCLTQGAWSNYHADCVAAAGSDAWPFAMLALFAQGRQPERAFPSAA